MLVLFFSPFAFALAILICVAADNLDIGGVTWGYLFNEDLAGIRLSAHILISR